MLAPVGSARHAHDLIGAVLAIAAIGQGQKRIFGWALVDSLRPHRWIADGRAFPIPRWQLLCLCCGHAGYGGLPY